MSFVIYDENTAQVVHSSKTERGCKISKSKKYPEEKYLICNRAFYNEFVNIDITVYSLMSGAPVKIRRSDRGGVCDPSTERYWTM